MTTKNQTGIASEMIDAATRLADAQAICQTCAHRGKPERRKTEDVPHVTGGTCSAPFVHKVGRKFVNCFASPIWALDPIDPSEDLNPPGDLHQQQ